MDYFFQEVLGFLVLVGLSKLDEILSGALALDLRFGLGWF